MIHYSILFFAPFDDCDDGVLQGGPYIVFGCILYIVYCILFDYVVYCILYIVYYFFQLYIVYCILYTFCSVFIYVYIYKMSFEGAKLPKTGGV